MTYYVTYKGFSETDLQYVLQGPMRTLTDHVTGVQRIFRLPLTCQMLTIFSTAEARYFPVTLQAR